VGDHRRRERVDDRCEYEHGKDSVESGAMHWELWPSRPNLNYDDLARTLVTL